MGLTSGPELCVWIIGGDDVIPIPRINDPYGTAEDGKMPTDMAYCFEEAYLSDLMSDGDYDLSDKRVRNNVSRLPLENGMMRSSLEEDLQSYFNLCSLYEAEGIPVKDVVMTANADWIPASITMSHHLPLVYGKKGTGLVDHGMYISPELLVDNPRSLEIYLPVMEEAGMLLFNLHGSDSPGYSGFYSTGEAFDIGMARDSNARILNTVACFGARYAGYDRDDSMLLSSLFGGGKLLYVGSLIPVPMIADENQDAPLFAHLNSGSGSEKLMPIYCLYQFAGAPAGLAMMQAKLDYFHSFREIERDDFSLATAMMFGLYGNPMLSVQPVESVLKEARKKHVFPRTLETVRHFDRPVHIKKKTRLVDAQSEGDSSLLSMVRGLVDTNLAYIRTLVQRELYDRFGLPPRALYGIDSYEQELPDGSVESGYVFTYDDKSKHYGKLTLVEVDMKGGIRKVIKTK